MDNSSSEAAFWFRSEATKCSSADIIRIFLVSMCDALHDLVPFVQWRLKRDEVTVCNLAKKEHSSKSVIYVFKIVHMVPNRAKRHILFHIFVVHNYHVMKYLTILEVLSLNQM